MYKKKKSFSKKQTIFFILICCFVAGFFIGFISMDFGKNNNTINFLEEYLHNFRSGNFDNKTLLFQESFFKHSKLIFIIWLLGFLPIGGFLTFILILFKGASLGFTTALLTNLYGFGGGVTSLIMFLPQCVIIIPTCFFMSYCSTNYILLSSIKNDSKETTILKEYILTLIISLVFVLITVIIDVFIVPYFVENFLK